MTLVKPLYTVAVQQIKNPHIFALQNLLKFYLARTGYYFLFPYCTTLHHVSHNKEATENSNFSVSWSACDLASDVLLNTKHTDTHNVHQQYVNFSFRFITEIISS